MAAKANCWEYKKCMREPGGVKASDLGVCPAPTETRVDKVNGGMNAGRCCWTLAGTLCDGKIQGALASKLSNCMACDFYKLVVREEGAGYVGVAEIMKRLKRG